MPETADEPSQQTQPQATKIRKSPVRRLISVWHQCFTAVPRLWSSEQLNKKNFYEYKHTIRYMRLFLPTGFIFVAGSQSYSADVHAAGLEAERNMLAFIQA